MLWAACQRSPDCGGSAIGLVSIYLFISDLAEHAQLAEDFGRFTDVRPSRPPLAPRQLVLVSFDSVTLGALGRMQHGRHKAANYRWHVTLDELVVIDDPVPLDGLLDAASEPTARELADARRPPGGQLRDPSSEELLSLICAQRPELEPVVDHLRLVSRPERRRPAPDRAEPIVEYERDAVGVSLDLAGMTRERMALLSAWDGRSDEPFLTNVRQYRVLEDRAIEHDARVFGGWETVATGAVGMTRFESNGRRLTVINVNRTGIEHAIGVDLIYYSQDYDAYVVVQYKRRELATGERWQFRPDGRFDDELRRMRGLVRTEKDVRRPYEYRLDENCGFLKLCAPTTPDAFSTELVNGVYLPLAYWDVLERSGAATGPQGGRLLTYRSVGRYLTNGLFVDLVKSGWIGSRSTTSSAIRSVIEQGLAGGRSLILSASLTDAVLPAEEGRQGEDDALPF